MPEEQPISNENIPKGIETQLTPEALLEAANQRVTDGTATSEDHALVAGANIVASTMDDTREAPEPRTLADRTIVNDLYGPVTRQIPVLEDRVATDTFGGDLDSSRQELQTAQDMKTYLDGRDYTDTKGKLHDAETGQFKAAGLANEKPETETQGYETMSVMDKGGLLDKWADAANRGDKTMSIDIEDELVRRLDAEPSLSEDRKEQIFSTYTSMMESRRATNSENAVNAEPSSPEKASADKVPSENALDTPAIDFPPTENGEPTNPEDSGDGPRESLPGTSPIDEEPGTPADVVPTPPAEVEPTNPEDSGETDETSERNKALDQLRENIEKLKQSIEGLPDKQVVLDELAKIQDEWERLKNGESEDVDKEEVEPTEEMIKSPEAIAGEARIAYYEASNEYARAKIAAEGMFAGGEKKAAFETAGVALKEAREKWLSAEADLVRSADRIGEDLQLINDQERSEAQGILDTLLKTKEDSGDDYDGSLEAQIAAQQANLAKIDSYDAQIKEYIANREAQIQEFAVSELTELSKRVDDEMLAERTRRHPKLTKINNWLQKHPKTRIGVGLGLTGLGIVGAVTFNAPLVAFATGAKAGLSGYGSYNASRGIGELIASKKMNKAQLETIDDYLGASDRQSATRRNSKRLGAAVAVALAAAPAIIAMSEAHHAATAVSHSTGSGPTPPPPTKTIVVTPQGGNEYPWTFGMNNLGTNISAPDTLNKIVNNPYGIKFVGNGLGGGQGAIESVTIPGQGRFTDFAHINGAIAAIMGK